MVYLFKSGIEVRPNFHNPEGVIKQCNTLFRRYLTVYLVFISCLADFFYNSQGNKNPAISTSGNSGNWKIAENLDVFISGLNPN